MNNTPRKMLVTYALPYANGPLHLGHTVGFIQTDIWVRFQRLLGHTCHFVCGDDTHGTPTMLQAQQLGMTPEALIEKYHAEHAAALRDFHIGLDNFYTTHSPENYEFTQTLYKRLKNRGDIVERRICQAFDPIQNIFLPDRYVRGECPRCSAPNQYGDNCESCGATYTPTDLKNPISTLSGATPIEKESLHDFFCLDHYETFLQEWTHAEHLQEEVVKKLTEWFKAGLKQWDISRDAPYFGFEIPDKPGKYFYVWLDAPMGYMASFKNFSARNPHVSFEEYWNENSQTELYHFIGKDIIYFHALFWPAILKGANFRTPTNLFVHGFLTVNGQKMSKSRGTFIDARTYLNHLNPEYLRYYFASKLSSGIVDLDFQLEDFVQRINADLVGKLINIASRCAGFITQHFSGKLSAECSDRTLYNAFVDTGTQIAEHFQNREFSQAVREIMALADEANRYIDAQKPWVLIKSKDLLQTAHDVCSLGLNLFKLLMTYLQPILPKLAEEVEVFLNTKLSFMTRDLPLRDHTIQPFKPLIGRIQPEQVAAIMEASKNAMPTDKTKVKVEEIDIQDLEKIDLRIAKILDAKSVPDSDKLLELSVDIGGGETRRVFAGIKEAYRPDELIGKLTVMVANLAPRKMRFGISEGMVLAAGAGGQDLWLLEPHSGATPGMRVK